MATYYGWRCTETFATGKRRCYTLRWMMTQDQAIEWVALPDNHGKVLELIPGSGVEREVSTEPYVGWGQALPGAGEVEAAQEMGDRWRPKR